MSKASGHYVVMLHPPRPDFIENMTPDEDEIINQHFQYLKKLLDEGKLMLAGPLLDGALGLTIYNSGDEFEVKRWANEDPAVQKGVFTLEMHPLRLSLYENDK